ncbi:hypothetical protein Cni_G24364 [Canna indica]|uniref:Uncharacterized protein n=1 Tax=Canna indica TaxID=4628 RepID=A0AAQ3QN41_9LILI|nr:hypothetical protein Cni_G24364 [Canna indica]
MKLGLLPPLVILCSDIFLNNSPLISALPFDPTRIQTVEASTLRPSKVIYHPPTRLCVIRKLQTDPLKLGPCEQADGWGYTPQKFLFVKGTYFCLQAVESGKPAKLGIICSESDSSWDITSKQFSTKLPSGSTLCLDVDPGNTLITNPCLCLSSGACNQDSQWFEFADRNEVVEVSQVSSP